MLALCLMPLATYYAKMGPLLYVLQLYIFSYRLPFSTVSDCWNITAGVCLLPGKLKVISCEPCYDNFCSPHYRNVSFLYGTSHNVVVTFMSPFTAVYQLCRNYTKEASSYL